MNTPNPNPSPELRNHIAACLFCGSTTGAEPIKDNRKLWAVRCGCGLHGTWNTRRYGAIESWNDRAHRHRMAALKQSLSQTLPAPGEVKAGARKVLADTRIAAGSLFGDCPDDVAVSAMLAFATVAAANDEAFARGVEAAAKVAAGSLRVIRRPKDHETADCAWNEAALSIAAAIRLLSQGGGKA